MGANVVSGARDQIRDLFTSGPLGATLSPPSVPHHSRAARSNHAPDRLRAVPLATLRRRFRAGGTRARHEYRFGAEPTSVETRLRCPCGLAHAASQDGEP